MEILYFGFMSDSIIFKRNEKKKIHTLLHNICMNKHCVLN